MQTLIQELRYRQKSLTAKQLAAEVVTIFLAERKHTYYVEFDNRVFSVLCQKTREKAFSNKSFSEIIKWFKVQARKSLQKLALKPDPEPKSSYKTPQYSTLADPAKSEAVASPAINQSTDFEQELFSYRGKTTFDSLKLVILPVGCSGAFTASIMS